MKEKLEFNFELVFLKPSRSNQSLLSSINSDNIWMECFPIWAQIFCYRNSAPHTPPHVCVASRRFLFSDFYQISSSSSNCVFSQVTTQRALLYTKLWIHHTLLCCTESTVGVKNCYVWVFCDNITYWCKMKILWMRTNCSCRINSNWQPNHLTLL